MGACLVRGVGLGFGVGFAAGLGLDVGDGLGVAVGAGRGMVAVRGTAGRDAAVGVTLGCAVRARGNAISGAAGIGTDTAAPLGPLVSCGAAAASASAPSGSTTSVARRADRSLSTVRR